MAPPGTQIAGRTSTSAKSRSGLSRSLKRLLTTISHARPKPRSRPNTLSLFDIVTLNRASKSSTWELNSRLSTQYNPTSSTPRSTTTESISPPASQQPTPRPYSARKPRGPLMADRIADVRLESVYDEDDSCRGYVFAAALQDARHAQDIKALSSSSRH